MGPRDTISVLVIDDSATNRQAITTLLKGIPGIEVVGRALDGEDGLKQALYYKPDLITLDLNMPRPDGFSFLRLIMARQPTPVIVISSDARKESIFQALELGAVDFVVKPAIGDQAAWTECADELVAKISTLPRWRATPRARLVRAVRHAPRGAVGSAVVPPTRLLLIGSSTGGPAALTSMLPQLPFAPDAAIAVAQHMPGSFTQAFAERLDAISAYRVRHARDGERLLGGHLYIAPGESQTTIASEGGSARLVTTAPAAHERYAPSVDRLFESAARAWSQPALALVLTGMGNDGARGVVALRDRGVHVYAEDESTAVIFGMPQEAWKTGAVRQLLPLERLIAIAAAFLSGADGADSPKRR